MVKGFRTFVLRGNVVDLAVGIVIGAAFTMVVTAFVKGVIAPLIGLFGDANFDRFAYHVGSSGKHVFAYGDVLTELINFLLTAAVLYFFVVRPVNALVSRHKTQPEPEARVKSCPECLSKIPEPATRCAFCTVEQPALA